MNPKLPLPMNAGAEATMSPAERAKSSILIVEADANDRNNMRVAVKSLGYGNFYEAPNHAAALEKLQERPVTHIVFEAKKTNMPAKEFLQKVLEIDNKIVAIPASYDPNVDDVFDLLVMGAKGYVSKPITSDSLDSALIMATKGEPLADAVLNAKDRNEALIALAMSSLDKAATIMRQAAQFETARREIPRSLALMRRSAGLAKTFCKGGDEGMLEALEKFCLERSKGPATKLGRLRQRLKSGRGKDDEDSPTP
jgi:DNA-binding NarL/FixJ family response regulator